MSSGNVVEIIGAVVDVEFPRDDVPKVYDALNVGETGLTLEVQQQIGDGVVRTIAMGSTDGLKRGIAVSNTGAPVSVPVGQKTLGRIMNVLGEAIDDAGDIGAEEAWPIHRKAPDYRPSRFAEKCSKRASRLSTSSAPSTKAAKSVCLAAPVWARPFP